MSGIPTSASATPNPGVVLLRSILTLARQAPAIPLLIVATLILLAIVGPAIVPYDPIATDLGARNMPPWFAGGTSDHLLGTDTLGRDVLSRVVVGARVSLAVASLSILIGGLVGSLLGVVAGFYGGILDGVVMRAVDVALAFPAILIGLVLAVSIGPSFWVVVIVLALVLWSQYARLVRSEVLSIKERDFVLLAKIGGSSNRRVMSVHIVPNVLNSVIVLSTLQVGWIIIAEASLSFLGAGIPPPTPTWGGMVAQGRDYLEAQWWISIVPGTAILLAVLSFNLMGDWVRDSLDPKLRQL